MIERAVIAHQLPTTFSSMMFPQSSRRLFALALYEVLSGSFEENAGVETRSTIIRPHLEVERFASNYNREAEAVS